MEGRIIADFTEKEITNDVIIAFYSLRLIHYSPYLLKDLVLDIDRANHRFLGKDAPV